MTVAVAQPQQKEKRDPLETVLRGLQIAGSVYGIKEAQAKLDEIDAAKAERERKASGTMTPAEVQERQKEGFQIVEPGAAGSQTVKTTDGRSFGLVPPKPKAELAVSKFETYRGADGKNHIGRVDQTGLVQSPNDPLAGTQPKDNQPKPEKLPKVPAGEAVAIGSYSGLDAMLDNLSGDYTKYAGDKSLFERGVSKAGSMFPGSDTDAAKYDQAARQTAQAIGTVLEKGKLTDADYERKYLPMMPTFTDSPGVKEAKVRKLKEFAREKQKAEFAGLQQAGYDTGNFSLLPELPKEKVNGASGGWESTATAATNEAPKEVMQNGWIYDAKTHKPLRKAQ